MLTTRGGPASGPPLVVAPHQHSGRQGEASGFVLLTGIPGVITGEGGLTAGHDCDTGGGCGWSSSFGRIG